MDDWDLLRAYAERGTEEAFRELLRRHASMVFSTARRILNGDAHDAQDVAQRAFCLLAQKAARLPRTGSIGGWLYRTTYHLARETQRTEWRRLRRETQAATMPPPTPHSAESNPWESFAPILDDAIHSLPEPDQTLLIQRFLQRRSHREVAASLGISESAAKMRTHRSLERLRRTLVQRGVSLSSPALAESVWAHALEPAPEGMIAAIEQSLPAPLPPLPSPPPTQSLAHLVMQLAQTKTRLTLAVGLVLSVGWIAVHTLSSPQTTVSTDLGAAPVPTSGTNHQMPQRARLLSKRNHGASPTASGLSAAIARLQAALTDPWPSRRAPVDRVIAALRAFGSDRSAALPTLMETLNRSDLGQKVLAAYGLIEMGHAAAESLPEILQMTTTGRIAVLNNTIPKLIEAVAPDLSPIPSLLAAMANPSATGREWIAEAILGLIQKFPDTSEAASIHATFADLLSADFQHVRREAAVALSRWPGEKSPEPVPVLVEALALDRLRESNAGASIDQGATASTTVRMESRFEDVNWRFRAVKALRQLGPQARSSLAALDELRSLTAPDSELHREVLRALGTIDPARSSVDANIASAVAEGTRIDSLPERLRAGQASFEEMVEGLRFRQTESDCARALEALGDAARPAVPALVYALDQFESYEAAQCLKILAPDRLIDRVRLGQQTALGEVATALGDLGAAAKEAIPYLERIGAEIPMDEIGTAQAIADAIAAIDPQHPKTLYTFDDLWPATQALVREIQRSGKTQNPVYDLYLTRMQDLNAVPRARLLDFANALGIDPDLRRVFVDKLTERNPELAAQLPPNP